MHFSGVTFVRGLLLGVGAAAPIGPVNVEIARRTLRGGFWRGVALGVGAVTVDVSYAILTSLSLRRAIERPWLMEALGIGGAALLIYLGIACLRAARHQADVKGDDRGKIGGFGGNYLSGLMMTAVNPMTLAFWFVAVPGAVAQVTPDPARDLPVVCVAVFAATLGWVFAFAGLMALAGARAADKRRWLVAADVAGGVLLLAFAAAGIWRVFRERW